MKNKTIIIAKKYYSPHAIIALIKLIGFILLSLLFGFAIAFWGKGNSFIETYLITAIITLFGFGLTATVFVCQALEKFNSPNTIDVITRISKTLRLTLCLIVASLFFDFLASIIISKVLTFILDGLKYAVLIFSLICQFDILNAFIIIISSGKDDSNKKDE